MTDKKMINKIKGNLILIVCFGIIIVFSIFGFHPVNGSSMYPTYHDGQRIVGVKTILPIAKISRDDVVVAYSSELKELVIKRVAAIPGDEIVFNTDGTVTVNGELYAYGEGSALVSPVFTNELYPNPDNTLSMTVPAGRYFLIGDNHENSLDSRYLGTFPRKAILERIITK